VVGVQEEFGLTRPNLEPGTPSVCGMNGLRLTRVWVVRTAAAPPSIVVKYGGVVLRVVVCGVVLVVSFAVLFLLCVCV